MTMKRHTPASPDLAQRRYDRPGHIDPAHAERLLRISRSARTTGDDEAFLGSAPLEDDLAMEMGEAAVASMTSGEDTLAHDLDAEVDEETGGPFVRTSGSVEFAGGTDESNTADATREPIPLANHDDGLDENEDEDEE